MPISRVYRPKFFRDVTGQSHITETLRKEIENNMIGHAYLFSGPRGIGKTTSARIFAKALLNETNVAGEPPEDSDASKDVDEGRCIDLIEIDAASHTGVDHVREAIVEHVRFTPARWKRKVYIIDECHMLSTNAWNALLKTLEEPPEYAVFLFATTEIHKVPETIKSRCQRFEFRRIDPSAIVKRLQDIAKLEKVDISESVLRRIAHVSEGCLRDAENLFDQIISLGMDKIDDDSASLVLPIASIVRSAELLARCFERDVPLALQKLHALIEEGIPPLSILNDMIGIIQSLIRAEDPSELKRLQEGDENGKAILALVGKIDRNELGRSALMFLERRRDMKNGTDPIFLLELTMYALAGGLLTTVSTAVSASPTVSVPVPRVNPEPVRTPVVEEKRVEVPPPPITSIQAQEEKKETPKTNTAEFVATQNNLNAGEQKIEEPPLSHIPEGQPELNVHEIRKYWGIITKEVEKANRSLPFILKICTPERIEGSTLVLRFRYAFHREKLIEDIKTKSIVEDAIRLIMKNDKIILDGIVDAKESSSDSEQPNLDSAPADIVSRVLNAFGGTVVE